MKNLIEFLRQFIQNKGLFVFTSSIVTKLSMLFVNIIGARLISENDFGLFILIFSIFNIFAPLIGFGSNQGLLRFGSIEKDEKSKEILNNYIYYKGFINHIFVSITFLVVCYFYTLKYEGIGLIILCLGIRLFGYYFYNHAQAYFRINDNNKTYSILNMTVNVVGLILIGILTYILGMKGFLIGMAIAPWISLFFYSKNHKFSTLKPNLDLKSFWKYSIHASITYFFSDLLFAMDFLLIGLFLNESDIAFYKVSILLPMNLSFIPLTFMQTDYPKIARNYMNKEYLQFYTKNYYKIFIPLGILILIIGYFIKDFIIPLVFGTNYENSNSWVFYIILVALVGNMWMRNLYGNMVSAIGKSHWNTYVSIVALIIILILGLLLIPKYGIIGAAIGMATAFTFTGLILMFLFQKYLKKLPNVKDS
jgi:O-antigen/teichoic acid export membrane protein